MENEEEAEKAAVGGRDLLFVFVFLCLHKKINRSEKFISGLNVAQYCTSVFPNTIIVYCLKTISHRLYALKRNP